MLIDAEHVGVGILALFRIYILRESWLSMHLIQVVPLIDSVVISCDSNTPETTKETLLIFFLKRLFMIIFLHSKLEVTRD